MSAQHTVESIRADAEFQRAALRMRAVTWLTQGRAYSRERADAFGADIRLVQKELAAMERDGLLTSELVSPPRNQGIARRYYTLARKEAR